MRLEKKPSKMHKMPKKISSQIKQSKRLTKLKISLMKNPLHQMMKKQKLYKILKGKKEVQVLHLKALKLVLVLPQSRGPKSPPDLLSSGKEGVLKLIEEDPTTTEVHHHLTMIL